MVVRGRIELPTTRFSGTRFDANRAKYGELSEMAVAESIVGWTDLDGDTVSTDEPQQRLRVLARVTALRDVMGGAHRRYWGLQSALRWLALEHGVHAVGIPTRGSDGSGTGNLEAGELAHVTYRLELDDELADDVILRNVVVGDGPASNCLDQDADGDCAVDLAVSSSGEEAVTPSPALPRTGAPLLVFLLAALTSLVAGLALIRSAACLRRPGRP